MIPIVRGAGLLQEGVNRTIELLRSGEWVHVFSEGKVNQTKTLLPFRVISLSYFVQVFFLSRSFFRSFFQ